MSINDIIILVNDCGCIIAWKISWKDALTLKWRYCIALIMLISGLTLFIRVLIMLCLVVVSFSYEPLLLHLLKFTCHGLKILLLLFITYLSNLYFISACICICMWHGAQSEHICPSMTVIQHCMLTQLSAIFNLLSHQNVLCPSMQSALCKPFLVRASGV